MRYTKRKHHGARQATYEDLLKVPDTKVAEIIDGDLIVSPRPAPPHAVASSALGGELHHTFGRRGGGGASPPGGWWILFEPELHFGPQILVPDLAGWRRERLQRMPDTAYFTLAPDWACEMVSPSTARIDRVRKMDIYFQEGVSYLWLVDPLARTLEVFHLTDGDIVRAAAYDEPVKVRVSPFEALELDLSEIWLPEEDETPADDPGVAEGEPTDTQAETPADPD